MAKLTEEELLFRKVEEKVKKAIFEYGLIVDGDRILIGLSGGKDSLALVDLLGRRSKIFRPRFEVVVTHIVMSNIPYRSDIDYLKSRADEHGLSFFVHETSFDASTDTRKSPCFLCSWTRRKALFDIAKRHGCNKIALGHHQDDILETLLMNMIHQGAIGTMPPRLKMDKFDMEIIRPMCLVEEKDLNRIAVWRGYRKQIKNCPYESGSSRSDMKEMQLVRDPSQFDVIVTENLFGDILSDEASQITGSIGMIPSSSMGDGTNGLYEPIHGSAPDIAGQDKANPIGTILAAAMMLRYSFDMAAEADAIERAVDKTLRSGFRCGDIMQENCQLVGCKAIGAEIRSRI